MRPLPGIRTAHGSAAGATRSGSATTAAAADAALPGARDGETRSGQTMMPWWLLQSMSGLSPRAPNAGSRPPSTVDTGEAISSMPNAFTASATSDGPACPVRTRVGGPFSPSTPVRGGLRRHRRGLAGKWLQKHAALQMNERAARQGAVPALPRPTFSRSRPGRCRRDRPSSAHRARSCCRARRARRRPSRLRGGRYDRRPAPRPTTPWRVPGTPSSGPA